MIRADLLAAVAGFTDEAFIDLAQTGENGVSPASITSAAMQVISNGGDTVAAVIDDLRRLVQAVFDAGVDLRLPYFITSTRVCAALTFLTGESGAAFPGVTLRGGDLVGAPLIVSSSTPDNFNNDSPPTYSGTITLLDAAELIVADDGEATIEATEHATLNMDTAPDSPPTASTKMISLWQQNLVAWKVIRPISWKMRHAGAVAVLTGVMY